MSMFGLTLMKSSHDDSSSDSSNEPEPESQKTDIAKQGAQAELNEMVQ